MSNIEDSNAAVYTIDTRLQGRGVPLKSYIRPVINLKKSAITNKCGESNYDYIAGQNINYKSNDYCVISNSLVDENYVTVIKQEPLTYDELVTLSNGHEIGNFTYMNINGMSGYSDIGTIAYYESNSYYSGEQGTDLSGCNNNYETSIIKDIINEWSNDLSDDLVKVGMFKARLITTDDLLNFEYYINSQATYIYIKSDDTPTCFAQNYNGPDTDDLYYWTMSPSNDSTDLYAFRINGSITKSSVLSKNSIRPVINLKKCAITNTCE